MHAAADPRHPTLRKLNLRLQGGHQPAPLLASMGDTEGVLPARAARRTPEPAAAGA
jgi:hypothetical protein